MQDHGNYVMMKKFNYMLEIDILRNSSLKKMWVSLGVLFKGLGVQKDTQTPCWLRPGFQSHVPTFESQAAVDSNF